MEKAKGNRGNFASVTGDNVERPPEDTKTLAEMGATKDQSSKWQKLAAVPECSERTYGDMYTQALEETNYAYQTLKQYKRVAGAIEKCRRLHNVSWSLHQEVVPLAETEQDSLLATAKQEGYTQKEFRVVIQQEKRAAKIEQIESGNTALESSRQREY